MQLVLHTGAHFTEEERLIKCLLRNKAEFARLGVAVPGPSTFRGLMRDTLNAMRKNPPGPGAREVLLDVIMDDQRADRVILSDANFLRTPATAVREGVLYPDAPVRIQNVKQLFSDDEIEIFIAIRNPATLLPILFEKAADKSDAGFWGDRTAEDVRWSETLGLIRQAAPEVPITVWCNEDAPLLWGYVIRQMAGMEPSDKISGGFDLLTAIMSNDGMQRFRTYLAEHPDITEMQRRRVIAAFLDKFAVDEAIEEELDMPGWTSQRVEALTDAYDEDVLELQRLPGVEVITP